LFFKDLSLHGSLGSTDWLAHREPTHGTQIFFSFHFVFLVISFISFHFISFHFVCKAF